MVQGRIWIWEYWTDDAKLHFCQPKWAILCTREWHILAQGWGQYISYMITCMLSRYTKSPRCIEMYFNIHLSKRFFIFLILWISDHLNPIVSTHLFNIIFYANALHRRELTQTSMSLSLALMITLTLYDQRYPSKGSICLGDKLMTFYRNNKREN